MKRSTRRSILILLVHAAAFTAAYNMAFVLRLGLPLPDFAGKLIWITLGPVLAVKLVTFYLLGHWRLGWRHASFSDLAALLRAATLSTLVIATADLMVSRYNIPRLTLGLDWAMTILILGGMRALWRLSREELRMMAAGKNCRRALIVGATPAGEALAGQFLRDHRLNYLAVGYLDDDTGLHGSRLGGVPVVGSPDEAVALAERLGASEILVISDQLAGQRLRQLIEDGKQAGVQLRVIPATDDLLRGNYTVRIRDVDINDLLRREPVELSGDAIRRLVESQTVMVTGAGGSIGAEICRQVIKFSPRKLLLVERAENSLFLVDREFQELKSNVDIRPALADIVDRSRMEQLFAEHRPKVVFHAAAHKHVPMMEFNPAEAVKNNVLGTAGLAELAEAYGVDEFVLISTDKSVNPTSIMGATKLLAERYVHAYSEVGTTKFVVVRFGNVLGSAGSVVPIFQQQIHRGGPITITHPEMQRFFMTIPEASQLVLQAAAMGRGGEIFVLDMGEPVRIVDLAHDLIRLSRLTPDEIEIVYTGLRPGEKLSEELYFDDEEMLPTRHPKLRVAYHRPCELAEVRRQMAELRNVVEKSSDEVRATLERFIPGFDQESACEAEGVHAAGDDASIAHAAALLDESGITASDDSANPSDLGRVR